jgi:hypothetical protein
MAENSKFMRQYRRTRDMLKGITEDNYKAVLNTLYYVYPISFEKPNVQQFIRQKFAKYRSTDFDLFSLNMARLYRRNNSLKIAICCMPKSGSTFLVTSLTQIEALKLEMVYLQTPYMNVDFVHALSREHEVDELALLMHELRGKNWVSQMHVKWTRYTERIFETNGIRPIITFRNIFDCLVSMDDMLMKGEVDGFPMIRLPQDFKKMTEVERLGFLTEYVGPWYIDYVVSWHRSKIDNLKLYYEKDIIGFDANTAAKILQFIGKDDLAPEIVAKAFELTDEKKKKSSRINKGVAGRGEKIPMGSRERLKALARPYEKEVDFSGLL